VGLRAVASLRALLEATQFVLTDSTILKSA